MLYLDHHSILNVEHDLASLAVIANQNVQSIDVLHPAQEASIWSQWYDRISLKVQPPLEAWSVDGQKGVDKTK
jgi:hypothetical protein